MKTLGSALLVLALVAGCGGDAAHEGDGEAGRPSISGGEARPKPIRQVEQVLNAQRATLFSRYDAEGLGISSKDQPRRHHDPKAPVYLIVVYLKDEEDRPDGEHAIDGVPIRFVVSGPIGLDGAANGESLGGGYSSEQLEGE